jgi:tripartite ATP-independent transporter DctM subunit
MAMVAVAFVLLLIFLALGIPVAASLGLLAIGLIQGFSLLPLTRAIGEIAWTSSTGFLVVSVPLFVLLGEILLRSGIADRMYDAVAAWLSWLPGGLMHANVGSCSLFAAMSGSSVATAATIGTTAMPQLRAHRYNEPLFLGSLAAGGTLGILIPPSINMIVYGLITNTSIPRLYLAGIVPGVILTLLFMLVIGIACVLKPERGGIPMRASWSNRIATLPELLPPLVIFVVVVGSIYAGWATATESAALGVAAALALAGARRRLTWAMLSAALEGTMRTTAMIMFIILAAFFLNFAMTAVGLTQAVVGVVTGLHLGPLGLILAVIVFYLILGCFMDTMSMMIATIPVIAPIVFANGFDPVWFGIVMVVLVEAAMITPPVGINLYVIQGLRSEGGIGEIAIGIIPFLAAMVVLLGLLIAFPGIALWLPAIAN